VVGPLYRGTLSKHAKACKLRKKVSITLDFIIDNKEYTIWTFSTFTMGKVLQKKKARSGRSKARAKNNRLKSGHKKINVLGNQIIADNWYAAAIVLLTANRN
jgi:hypothetical protein